MNKQIKSKAKRLAARRRLKGFMAKSALVLSGVAVFCVVYALVTPGLTAEWPLQCGLEEHVHDESCYVLAEAAEAEPQTELICTLEESEGHTHDDSCYTDVQGALVCEDTDETHEHTDACYECTRELTCGQEEAEGHTHTEACYQLAEEPAESAEGTYVLQCEKQEHTHSEGCYIVPDAEETYYCGYLTEHTHDESCYFENGQLKCNIPEHIHTDECLAVPTTILLDESFRYQTDLSSINFYIVGEASYLAAPDAQPESEPVAETSGEETLNEETPIEETSGEEISTEETFAEETLGEETSVEETPVAEKAMEAIAAEPENQVTESQTAGLKFDVTVCDDQAQYDAYEAQLAEDGDVLAMQILNFSLEYEGNELDLSGCQVYAELTPTETLLSYAESGAGLMTAELSDETEDAENTPEMGLLLTAGSDDDTYESAPLLDEANTTITVPISGNTLRTAAIAGANPHFTVQYYALLSRVTQVKPTTGSYDEIPVINTAGNGDGTGGNLPQNGTTPALTNLYVDKATGQLATTTELTKIYNDENFEYLSAPGLQYFNVVINNTESNYDTFKIWVLKEGKDASSTNEADWEIYTYDPKTTRVTNRPESVQPGSGYILIQDKTVIRLVYKPAEETFSSDATFYDYDISDGYIYTSKEEAESQTNKKNVSSQKNNKSQTYYANVDQKGINHPDNYTGSGAKLGFGNLPPTGLYSTTWNGNKPNTANPNGFNNCTFGLVADSLNNGMLQYNINAPKLFNEEDPMSGKTQITDRQLGFARVGDTYTLSSVTQGDSTIVDSLDSFQKRGNWNNTRFIYSNNFWPLDSLAGENNHDLKFGRTDLLDYRKAVGNGTTATFLEADFPKGEGKDRNAYFGMHFNIGFELTRNYVGPLEYYFFGDDDMWVFLEHPDGHTELICDIGGVHASVGEYVNLWDYIDPSVLENLQKDPETGKEETAKYKLKFFYTERGASGSTCWMQFTLPTVVGLDLDEYLEQQVTETTGALRIEKQLDGVENISDFEFELILTDADGKEYLPDNYMVRGANGELLEGDNAKEYIANGDTFKLKAGDVLVVHGLPTGTQYRVTEHPDSTLGYHTTIAITDGDSTETTTIEGTVAEGSVIANATSKVVFTNHASYELPATGGSGTLPLYTSGAAIVFFALLLMHDKKTQRKGDAVC